MSALPPPPQGVPEVRWREAILAAADAFDVPEESIFTAGRRKAVIDARYCVIGLIAERHPKLTAAAFAEAVPSLGRSAVSRARHCCREWLKVDPGFARRYNEARRGVS